jgi:hypothetical protein
MNQRRHFNNVILMMALDAPPSSSILSSPQLRQAVCGEQNKARAEQMLLEWTCILSISIGLNRQPSFSVITVSSTTHVSTASCLLHNRYFSYLFNS